MGGITGVYNYYDQQPVREGLIHEMSSVLRHRGPAGEGEYYDRGLALGHRCLSLVDVDRAQQPQFNEDHSKALFFDGRIYNYRQLRQYLESRGHCFQSDFDGEVILHLYEEKGVGCLDDLQGMFSLALWDKRANRLLLARDRLGIKPLYYYSDGYRLIFASEIKAIFQDKTVAKELNPRGVADYFTYLYVPAPKSIFLGIYKLPPGYYLLCSPQGYTVQKYWDIEFAPAGGEKKSLEQYKCTLLDLLSKSISDQLSSEPSAGLVLSGGIDSSALLALSHQQGIQTRSIKGPDLDEPSFARLLASRFHVPYEEWSLSPMELLKRLDHLVWFYDEPLGDARAVLSYELARLASQSMKLVLSGEGGDFVGYRCFKLWGDRLRWLSSSRANCPALMAGAGLIPQWLPGKRLEASGYSTACFFPEETHRLLNRDFYHDLRGYDPCILFRDLYRKMINLDPFSRRQYLDMKTYLPDNVLTRVDRATMANSLETRLPLLDHRLIEFLAQVPPHFKIQGLEERYLFKKALEGILPSAILSHQPQDFDFICRSWLLNEWQTQEEGYGGGRQFSSLSDILNLEQISSLWQRHQQGKKDYSRQIWAALFFQRWYRQHMSPTDKEQRREDYLLAAC